MFEYDLVSFKKKNQTEECLDIYNLNESGVYQPEVFLVISSSKDLIFVKEANWILNTIQMIFLSKRSRKIEIYVAPQMHDIKQKRYNFFLWLPYFLNVKDYEVRNVFILLHTLTHTHTHTHTHIYIYIYIYIYKINMIMNNIPF